MHQKVIDALGRISRQPIRYVVNTHLHGDHTAGNEAMAKLGAAPGSVVAAGKAFPGRSRPLCAYPKHAQYNGQGDPEDAKNSSCRE
jgi:glyoxylase-like metal-dependent hydrolase (beta-lactamase superfamily II)